MLGFYNLEEPIRIIGIDPGTDTLGVSVLFVDLRSNAIALQMSQTFQGARMAREYKWVSQFHGDKAARLKAHHDNLFTLFEYWQPHEVISEAPFFGRIPQVYSALVECLTSIRSALIQHDTRQTLFTVDPPTVKNAVGVNGKSGDKELMRGGIKGLLASGKLQNPEGIDIDALDEHSIDSIAVGYVRAKYVTDHNAYISQSFDRR